MALTVLVVDVQARPQVNLTLQVGQVSETVVVTEQSPQLETETSELGEVVNSRTATTLPLNGRNFAQLAQLAMGVAPSEPSACGRSVVQATSGTGQSSDVRQPPSPCTNASTGASSTIGAAPRRCSSKKSSSSGSQSTGSRSATSGGTWSQGPSSSRLRASIRR